MFEKILVCLDGSDLAEQILPVIEEEAVRFGKVILLRVVAMPEVTLPLGVPGAPGVSMHTEGMLEHFQKGLAEAPGYLEKMAQPLRARGADVECVVLEGIPGEAIVSYAKDNGVGIIAVATHGHSGFRSVILGSTAAYVLKNSGLPILMVSPVKHKKSA